MVPPRKKKLTEVEEKSLIDKYGEMVADGTLAKMKTREKKFKPIACHLNSMNCGGIDNVMIGGLGFEYDGEEGGDGRFVCEEVEQNGLGLKKKRKREVSGLLGKKAWGFIGSQPRKMKEMEARFEQREVEREMERQRSEGFRMECEQEREWKWEEWVKNKEEKEKAREQVKKQRMNRRRSEWKKMMDDMLGHHWAEMGQMQSRILHEQQNLTS